MAIQTRRSLEREVLSLVNAHSIEKILHALVEVCHARSIADQTGQWARLCGSITESERMAGEYEL